VFREVRRVLRDDGTVWLNLGDSYATTPKGPDGSSSGLTNGAQIRITTPKHFDRPMKNLLGIPWRVAFALQDDGWILRNAVVWDKPNAMPESVTDRLSTTYELVFLLSKSRRYRFDLDAIREPLVRPEALTEGIVFGGRNAGESKVGSAARRGGAHRSVYGQPASAHPPGTRPQTNCGPTGQQHTGQHPKGRNPGDVWAVPTTPYPGAHFATMPPALARRCVLAGCPEGGIVLDPFVGSGTTALVANQLGRRAVGIDLSALYLVQALRRCKDAPLPFEAQS
jgi:site-specific DNA-methyltransferase (cytosine-N4-specific)